MKCGDDRWHEVFARDGGKCRYCDMDLLQDFQHYQMSSVDHIKHQSLGGGDELDNLALSCIGCNTRLSRAKKMQTIEERRAYLQSPESSRGARVMYEEHRSKLR